MTRLSPLSPFRRARAGYTLVELAVVILLLGIAAAVAGPKITTTLHRHRAEAAARRIAADLELLRETARNTSTAQSVLFNLSTSSYQMPGISDPDRPSKRYEVSLAGIGIDARIAAVDAGGDEALVIDGYGTPDSDARITVACGRHAKAVVLNAATGKVTLE